MAKKFEIGSGLSIVVGADVEDFHDEMRCVVLAANVLYSPMVVTIGADGGQEISQMVMQSPSAFTYLLIVAESLEQFADRLMKARGEGWDVLFWYVQVDGKYLQWVSRPHDPKLSVGKVLMEALEDAVSEFGGLELPRLKLEKVRGTEGQRFCDPEPFPGVFVKSIQKMDLVARGQ